MKKPASESTYRLELWVSAYFEEKKGVKGEGQPYNAKMRNMFGDLVEQLAIIVMKSAGVDIKAGNEAVNLIKEKVKSTHTKEVLTGIGSFGSLYSIKEVLSDYANPVLVQSIDGVGTKTIIARKMKKFNTIGIDLLSACANDILVMGAKPLTFLDYIANDKLNPIIVDKIVEGMAKACEETGVSLVGGETAEMPDTYLPGEHDLVGVITGIVDKDKIITGKNISPGDVLVGLPSNGLHTNGYSLARKIFFKDMSYCLLYTSDAADE